MLLYVVASVVARSFTGHNQAWMGDAAQLVPPIVFAVMSLVVAGRSRAQVRTFWNLNAIHAVIWALGQMVWLYFDVFRGGVPVVSPTDPIFFISSIPLAAALYGRPEHDRPRWLFDIVVLDVVLIALFAAFLYLYFVVSIQVTDGPQEVYNRNLTQLLNARNLAIAIWGAWVWSTAPAGWKRMLGIYALGLLAAFFGGFVYDYLEHTSGYVGGGLADLSWMVPFLLMSLAAARAFDQQLFEPADEAPPLSRTPMVSLIGIALLVAIPPIDELARRIFVVSPAAEIVRTRLALAMMMPFGVVVMVREFLSRKALVRAGEELVTTREQLTQKEKLAAVGQLVSGVAHELNNPLQGVLGYAELMLAGRGSESESEELRAIRDNANRAAGIVRNLLTFAGRDSTTRAWQQINNIVRDAVAMREPHLQSNGIDLRVEVAERLPLVYVDASRLADVLVNMIQNAEAAIVARRSGDAPKSVVPVRARGEIVITTGWKGNPDRILVEVADNGSGLRDEDLNRVFDPFFTTREVGSGPGLGLSVCYGIVREHGGEITARNRDTGGAAFTIELPVMAVSLASAAPASPSQPSPPVPRTGDPRPVSTSPVFTFVPPDELEVDKSPRRRKALVVDDEESNAALVRRVLSGAGYDVESTTLSRRALVMIERTAYDCVIADVKMPELSGQELYSRVCAIRPEMARRFIFITGDIDGEDTREFLDQSRCSYFMKPFNLERLTSAVDQLTGREASDTIG